MPDRRRVRVAGRAWPDRLARSTVHINTTVTLVKSVLPDQWTVEHDGTVIGDLWRSWPPTRKTPVWRCTTRSGAGHRPAGTWCARRNDALCALLGEAGVGVGVVDQKAGGPA